MSTVRIALANLPYPESPTRAVDRAVAAIAEAGTRGAQVVCFPEAYVPGYRWPGRSLPAPDARFLESAHAAVAVAAAGARVAVVLGTERFTGRCFRLSALVFGADGALLGHQDKVQLDPGEHEEALYEPGTERRLFEFGPLRFGISICHEGFRSPRPCAGQPGAVHSWCSTPTTPKRSPAPSSPRRTATRATRSTSAAHSAAPPRTRASSPR